MAFGGYGYKKMWHWGMRSDLPTASQAVSSNVLYITPFTMDSICDFTVNGMKGKWDYENVEIMGYNWVITWTIGVYKRMRGRTGSAGTLELIGKSSATWSGSGSTARTIVYDFSSATSVASTEIKNIIDGQLYLAQQWNVVCTGVGITNVNKFGNIVASGTWMYENSGVTTFPQTIAALAGSAKQDQEHWIGER